MSLKISGNIAVSNTRELDVTGASGKYDDWHPNVSTSSASTSITLSFDMPYHQLSLTAATSISFSNLSVGRSTVVHLDLSTSFYTPSWNVAVKWPGGTEPTWSSNRYWIVNLIVGIGGSIIFGSAKGFEGSSGGATYPAGTVFIGRPATGTPSIADLAGVSEDISSDIGAVSSISTCGIYFLKQSTTGSYIRFRVTIGNGGGDGFHNWYTPGGLSNNIASNVYQTFWYEDTVNPTHTRVVKKALGTNTLLTDSGWISSATTDTGASGTVTANASAEAGVSGTTSDSDQQNAYFECWARATGYADTLVAKFVCQANASATSQACFTGDVLLYKWDTSSNTCIQTSMIQAYDEWVNREENETQYVLGQSNNVKQILRFNEFGTTELIYGINGSDPFVTGGHPFLTTDGWKCTNIERGNQNYPDVELTQLEIGDRLIKYDVDRNEYYEQEVLNITSSLLTKMVYLIDVGGDDTYIANGYIVHNK